MKSKLTLIVFLWMFASIIFETCYTEQYDTAWTCVMYFKNNLFILCLLQCMKTKINSKMINATSIYVVFKLLYEILTIFSVIGGVIATSTFDIITFAVMYLCTIYLLDHEK